MVTIEQILRYEKSHGVKLVDLVHSVQTTYETGPDWKEDTQVKAHVIEAMDYDLAKLVYDYISSTDDILITRICRTQSLNTRLGTIVHAKRAEFYRSRIQYNLD